MGKTAGTARLPLPESLTVGLAAIGYRDLTETRGPHYWGHPKHRGLRIQLVASNIAGATTVVAMTPDRPRPEHYDIDALLKILEQAVRSLESPNRIAQ